MKHPATAVVLVLAAALVPSATAAKGPHAAPSTSSIAQYVEQLPSAAGSVPLGNGSGAVARLSPAAGKALSKSGGSDASTLQKIAVDSQAGAPAEAQVGNAQASPPATRASAPTASGSQRTSKAGRGTSKAKGTSKAQGTSKATATPVPSSASSPAVGPAPPAHAPGAVSAAASTLGATNLLALAVVLVALTAGAVLLARRQQH